jgi:PAS domain S-box-containing protein
MQEGSKGHGSDHSQVRQRAEDLLQAHLHDPETPSASEVRSMAEQCEARRGELETQNEELRRVRRQLEHYRDRYVNLYDFAPLGYLTLDEDGYVQEVNLAGAKMLAVDRNDLIGHPLVDYVAESDRPAFLDHVRRCSHGREEVTSEVMLQAKDGPAIVVQIHSIPIEEENQEEQEEREDDIPQATFCKTAVTDITRRKQAEDQLRAFNETLEQRVAERTAEAQQRASQLRTLTLQLGQAEQQERRRLAQILQDRLQQLLIAGRLALSELEDHLRDEPIRKLVARVERLLEQSITESQQLTVELSPPVLYEAGLAAGLDWLARHMQRTHRLTVEVEADPLAEPSEESVRGFLFEAVRELLANVVAHAQTDQARVTMERADESEVRIEVVDEGVGFDPEDLKCREAVGGVFGLFSIRERLEVLGGRLEIDSAPHKGTRMVMLAPRRQQPLPELRMPAVATSGQVETPAEMEPEAECPTTDITRVLLADDHAVIRHGLAELLGRQVGIAVVGEAADGEEAVALARKTRPHVILMDAVMPRLNGVEATRQIKARWPETRIIALSMYDEGEMPAAMYDAGVALYLSKTVAPDSLVAAVLEQGEQARQSRAGAAEGGSTQGLATGS